MPVESHIQNFMDCMKSRKQPNCTVDIAARAVAGPHLANLAMLKKTQVAACLTAISRLISEQRLPSGCWRWRRAFSACVRLDTPSVRR